MTRWAGLPDIRYYRFDVEEGLEDIGLAELTITEIVEHTQGCIGKGDKGKNIKKCAQDLAGRFRSEL